VIDFERDSSADFSDLYAACSTPCLAKGTRRYRQTCENTI
jgi:hypothetical protein